MDDRADVPEPAAAANSAVVGRRTRMPRIAWLVVAVGLAVMVEWAVTARIGTPAAASGPGPGVNRPAAAFDLQTLDGQRVALRDFAGRPLVVNFWASWCPPCREEAPLLVELARRAPNGLALVGVLYQDSPDAARKFAAEFSVTYPTLLDPDGRTAIDYGLTGIPETFFIDRSGVIRGHQVGALTQADLDAKLQTIVGP